MPSIRVIASVAEGFGVTPADLVGPGRTAPIARARFAAMRALKLRGLSYPRIGSLLGNRDHTTIMHGVARARAIYAIDPDFAWLCDRLAAA